jgi:hypothetical protein
MGYAIPIYRCGLWQAAGGGENTKEGTGEEWRSGGGEGLMMSSGDRLVGWGWLDEWPVDKWIWSTPRIRRTK